MPFLLVFLRSELPSARAAQEALLQLSSWQGDVQTFRLLATANDGYLQQQLGSSTRFIHAAVILGQRDMVQPCLASMTALPESLEILTDLLSAKEAAVSVLAARTLTRLFDIRRRDVCIHLIAFGMADRFQRWNHSVMTILLEAGFDVDVACPYAVELEVLNDRYDLDDVPVPWRMSILDYQYYKSKALHAVMQPYSLRIDTVFDREGLSGASQEGFQALSIYLSRWRADSEGHGRLAQFLQLFLVEQISVEDREPDWLVINNLIDYGVDPGLPELVGLGLQDLFGAMIRLIANHGPTDVGRAALQRLMDRGAQLDAQAFISAVSRRNTHGLEIVQNLGADIVMFGSHALVQSLRRGNTKAVDWLVERGVDPLHPIQDGKGSCLTVLGAAINPDYSLPHFPGMSPHFIGPTYSRGALDAVLNLVRLGVRPLFHPNDASPVDFLIAIFSFCEGFLPPVLAEYGHVMRPLYREALQLPSNKALQLLEYIAVLKDWDLFEEIANQGQLAGPGNPLAMLILYKAPPAIIRKIIRITPDHNTHTLHYDRRLSASEAAAQVWNVQLLRELVLAGSEADRAVSDVWTNRSLQHACRSNAVSAAEAQAQIETVQYLLKLGVPIDGHDDSDMKMSPLQMASSVGSLELVLLLLKHGADVNIVRIRWNGEEMTSLDFAAKDGRLDVVQVLLNAGATSFTTQSTPFDGAIDRALKWSHDETAKLLCRYALSKGLQLCEEHLKLVS